jgi:hypothetical protein
MSTNLNDNLAELLKSVRTRPLFVMHLDARMLIVGDTRERTKASIVSLQLRVYCEPGRPGP